MVPGEPTESPFAYHPFEELYSRAVRDVVNRRLEPRERESAARALGFLLRERLVDEAVATDVLTALHCSLGIPKVVMTLLVGLRDALGDHEKIEEWTRRAAGRAHSERHVESFVMATRILVGLRNFDGALATSWQLSLIRASEDPRLRRRLLLLADEYARRFGAEARWVTTVRARYILGTSPDAERAGIETDGGGE